MFFVPGKKKFIYLKIRIKKKENISLISKQFVYEDQFVYENYNTIIDIPENRYFSFIVYIGNDLRYRHYKIVIYNYHNQLVQEIEIH